MKAIVIATVCLVLAGCATGNIYHDRILGRYNPPALDAGSSLTLLEKGVFLSDWWGQEMKTGNILGGWTSGRWYRKENRVVLRYVTNRKQSEAVFTINEEADRPSLKLVQEGEFPFIAFFGTNYPKEEEHHETFETSLRAVRKRQERQPNQSVQRTGEDARR